MKKATIILITIIWFSNNLYAQLDSNSPYSNSTYFGIGTGINSHYGIIGLRANQRVFNSLYLDGSAGIGHWGYKTSLGLIVLSQNKKGWSAGISYSHSSGIDDIEIDLEAKDTVQDIILKYDVPMNLNPAQTINAYAHHHWSFTNGSRVFFEIGFSYAVNREPYKTVDPNLKLAEESKKILDNLQPGGLLISLGYNFTVSKKQKLE